MMLLVGLDPLRGLVQIADTLEPKDSAREALTSCADHIDSQSTNLCVVLKTLRSFKLSPRPPTVLDSA